MDIQVTATIAGIFTALFGLSITITTLMFKSFRKEMTVSFEGCQKLCGIEMTHLVNDVKEIKEDIKALKG